MTPIEEIKSKLDIVDFLQGYLRLQKAGINFKALCPFHKEKTASFFVSPARQSWHCFGCSKSGDHFSFLQEIEGIDFIEALRFLAQRTGVELKRGEVFKESNERPRLFEVCSIATQFFEKQLAASASGKEVKAYLASRGLKDETAREFRLGFAPQNRDGLYRFLRGQGFAAQDIERAGLAIKRKTAVPGSVEPAYFDRFRGRIIFPLSDQHGRVVGFTGRIFGRSEGEYDPKYLNTPHTPLFDKGRILYGLDHAKTAIRAKGSAVVVEGQMDFLLSHQAGVTHVVATSGTALTADHLRIIKRFTDTVVFAFDMDRAGERAARNAFELALAEDFNVKMAKVAEGKDPADLVLHDPALWENAVAGASSVVSYFLDRAVENYDRASAEGKRLITAAVLPFLQRMANAVERAHWVAELARALEVREESVWEELKRLPTLTAPSLIPGAVASSADSLRKEIPPREVIEEHVLAALCEHPELLRDVQEIAPAFSERLVPLYEHLCRRDEAASGEFVEETTARTLDAALELLAAKRLPFADETGDTGYDPRVELATLLRRLQEAVLREELDALRTRLVNAEQRSSQREIEELGRHIKERYAALHELQNVSLLGINSVTSHTKTGFLDVTG